VLRTRSTAILRTTISLTEDSILIPKSVKEKYKEKLNIFLEYNDVTDTEVYHSCKLRAHTFATSFLILQESSGGCFDPSEALLYLTAWGYLLAFDVTFNLK
jgi:hypothetical protein